MEIEVCDIRYDEGLRSRVEKHIMPTIVACSNHGVSGRPLVREREREWKIISELGNSLVLNVGGLWDSMMRIMRKPRK